MEEDYTEARAEMGVKLPHAKGRQSHLKLEEAGRVLSLVCGREHDLAITSKRIRYLEINLPKKAKTCTQKTIRN